MQRTFKCKCQQGHNKHHKIPLKKILYQLTTKGKKRTKKELVCTFLASIYTNKLHNVILYSIQSD